MNLANAVADGCRGNLPQCVDAEWARRDCPPRFAPVRTLPPAPLRVVTHVEPPMVNPFRNVPSTRRGETRGPAGAMRVQLLRAMAAAPDLWWTSRDLRAQLDRRETPDAMWSKLGRMVVERLVRVQGGKRSRSWQLTAAGRSLAASLAESGAA